MKQIYKYEAQMVDEFSINMPTGAEILCCQTQRGRPMIWAFVDPQNEYEERFFRMAGTGHPINQHSMKYISTIQNSSGSFVFHLFEIMSSAILRLEEK